MRRYARWVGITAAVLFATGFPAFVINDAVLWYPVAVIGCLGFFALVVILPAYLLERLAEWRQNARLRSR
jgi:uncharacterized membrane protein